MRTTASQLPRCSQRSCFYAYPPVGRRAWLAAAGASQTLPDSRLHAAAPIAEPSASLAPLDLAQWLVAQGGRVSGAELHYQVAGDGGQVRRELRATQALSAGDRLLEVPRACQLNYADADEPKLTALMDKVPMSDAGRPAWQFRMGLLLVWHRLRGAASPLAGYISQLPGVAPGIATPEVAMLLAERKLKEAQHSRLVADARGQARWLRKFCDDVLAPLPGTLADAFGGVRVTEELMGWGVAIAMSRSFALTRRPGHTIVPLVDMADHSFTSNAEIRAFDDGSVAMIANRGLSPGDAIYLKYGSHSNRDLLLSYGFVIPSNPFNAFEFDFDAEIVLRAVEQFAGAGGPTGGSSPAASLKSWQTDLLAALQLTGPDALTLVSIGGPCKAANGTTAAAAGGDGAAGPSPVDGRLLAAMRVMLAEDRGALGGAGLEELQRWDAAPGGAAAEALVLKGLVGLCTVLYKAFPTTIQEDRAALEAAAAAAGPSAAAPEEPVAARSAGKGFGAPKKGAGGKAAAAVDSAAAAAGNAMLIEYRLDSKRVLEDATRSLLQRLADVSKAADASRS